LENSEKEIKIANVLGFEKLFFATSRGAAPLYQPLMSDD
jgi:hypothetical protein